MSPSRAIVLLVAIAAIILADTAGAQTAQGKQRSNAAFKFPTSVGAFRRTNVTTFAPGNVSASYSSPAGLISAYVYPARAPYSPSLPAHFEQCRREVRQLWGRTRTSSKRSTSINRNGRTYPGMEEVFTGKVGGAEVISTLVLFKADDRYLKFRFTSPKAASGRSAANLGAFVQKFPWPR